jgi:uncharacterized protein (TIGR00369 family)
MGEASLPPRRISESRVTLVQLMLPADANPSGSIHGGIIMKLVDEAGALAAARHARRRIVTAHIDSMDFLAPVYVGDLVSFKAQVNDVGRTSMEVGVRVEAENMETGEIRHVSTAYLVYVAVDDEGRPCPVPPLIAETEEERQQMAAAKIRREYRQRREEALRASRGAGETTR